MSNTLTRTNELPSGGASGKERCAELLAWMIDLLEAESGIVWNAADSVLRPLCAHSKNEHPPQIEMKREEHTQLLTKVAQSKKSLLVPPDRESPNQSKTLLLGSIDGAGDFIFELIVNAPSLDAAQSETLLQQFTKVLREACKASEHETTESVQQPEPPHQRVVDPVALSRFVRTIHDSIDLTITASNIANETAHLLDCDRVSVLALIRGKFQLVSINGQSSINRRSNVTRLLEKLADRTLRCGETFWYPHDTELPSQISSVLEEYLSVSATRRLGVIPFYLKDRDVEAFGDPSEMTTNRVIGGLIIEDFHERRAQATAEQTLQFITKHSNCALRNATEHQGLFLYSLWKQLGKLHLLTAPKTLPKTAAIGLGTVLILMLLMFVRVDFYVSANGMLMPAQYKPIFAPVDAKVERLLVDPGQSVEPGEVLLVMSSDEHSYRVEELSSELSFAKERLTIIEDNRYSSRADEKTEEQIVSLKNQIQSLETQRKLLDKISQQMTIKSPLRGRVITWDINRKLEDRYVQSGEILLEIADGDGAWELDVDLPLRRQGHVARALAEGDSSHLDVSFVLATDPSKTHLGRVIGIDQSVSINADNEQIIKVRVAIDDANLCVDQVRTGVTAKVYCGRSSLGYLWLHDLSEFFNKRVLFWFR